MILQADKFSCGAAALVNALRAIGGRIPVIAAGRLARTDPVLGTTDIGVRRAIRALGYQPRNIGVVNSSTQAVAALRGHLIAGEPVLLLVDRDEHWVAAVGVIGNRFIIVDSADDDLTLVLTGRELTRRWRARSGPHSLYTGVAITGI